MSDSNELGKDSAWREKLLKSLNECKSRKERGGGCGWLIFALFLAVLSGVLPYASRQLAIGLMRDNAFGYWVLGLSSVILLPVLLGRARNAATRISWKLRAKDAQDELLYSKNCRRPIAYLRSFALDRQFERRSFLELFLGTMPTPTKEQAIVGQLRKIGPVLAIGKPNEILPTLGAARFYVDDEFWQQKVADLVDASELVLWTTGISNGLVWEAGHLVENLDPRKLIVWAHPAALNLKEKNRENSWQEFMENAGKCFPKPFPQKLENVHFFVFDSDWSPIPVTSHVKHCFSSATNSALKQAICHTRDSKNFTGHDALASVDTTDMTSVLGVRKIANHWPLTLLIGYVSLCTTLVSQLIHGYISQIWYQFPAPHYIFDLVGIPVSALLGYKLTRRSGLWFVIAASTIWLGMSSILSMIIYSASISWDMLIWFLIPLSFYSAFAFCLRQRIRLANSLFVALFVLAITIDVVGRSSGALKVYMNSDYLEPDIVWAEFWNSILSPFVSLGIGPLIVAFLGTFLYVVLLKLFAIPFASKSDE